MHIVAPIYCPSHTKILIHKPITTMDEKNTVLSTQTRLQIKGNIATNFLIVPESFKLGYLPENFLIQKTSSSVDEKKNLIMFFSYSLTSQAANQFVKLNYKQRRLLMNLFYTTVNFLNRELISVNYLFRKHLHIFGFGYRAYLNSSKKVLGLKLGYSHKIYVKMRKYQKIKKINRYNITIKGPFKDILAQTCADIRKFKVPDAYKGKGVRYMGEKIILKVGKKVQDR